MNRPLILRMLPDRQRIAVWSRLYRRQRRDWSSLYKSASLRHAPLVTMELVRGDTISDCIAFTGVYEPALTQRLLKAARRGGTLVDVGANLGYFSLVWAASNPSNKCIAFEASPRNIDILRRNIVRNGLDEQIRVVPAAAGAAPGKLRFDLGPSEQTGWGGLTLGDSDRCVDVDVVRVDDVMPAGSHIAMLKVDTEGADAWVLLGCERLLKNALVREIWYEENKPRMEALGITVDSAQNYLRSLGYLTHPHSDPSGEVVEWSAVHLTTPPPDLSS